MKYVIKDYYYEKDMTDEIIEQAINKNIVKIVSFNVKDACRIVLPEGVKKRIQH